jgi:hypothetical protein
MAFTVPKYEEIFETIVADNILAIVARDMKLALDYFYLADALPDFQQRTLGQFVSLSFPALAIEPNNNTTSDEGAHADEELKMDLFLAVQDSSAATVTRNLFKYVRALKAILRAASSGDYTTGSTKVTAVSIEINSDYGLIGKNADTNEYMRPAHLDLTIKFTER